MARVHIENVYKRYEGGHEAVNDLTLRIEHGEFLVLVGPSGCGKSTTLRMIAGLEQINAGLIRIGDKTVNDIPPKDRDIAMVFQNYALYPHMSVYDNMAFGLKLRKLPKPEIHRRVMKAARTLDLDDLLKRRPKALSGGQRQRVAMGRAIVRKPSVFLFDEPLSNLDAKMRVEMRKEILQLHRHISTTMIYVTHDQIEAMTLGDRICVMNKGHIEQVGVPSMIFDYPATLFVAKFIGTPQMNLFKGHLRFETGRIVFDGGNIQCPLPEKMAAMLSGCEGRSVFLGLRPRALSMVHETSKTCTISGQIEVSEMLGEEVLLHLVNGPHEFICSVHPHETAELTDGEVRFVPNLKQAHIFDAETGRNLTLPVTISEATLPQKSGK